MATTHFDGKRPSFRHTYVGKFKDRNSDIRTAGVLTYGEGDSLEDCLRQPSLSAPVEIPPTVEKYRTFTDPGLGKIRTHYGKHNDPKYYDLISHGLQSSDKDLIAADLVNPGLETNFENRRRELTENIYHSHKLAPLSKIPVGVLPKNIDPLTHTFGMKNIPNDFARDVVNPNKTRDEVEQETSYMHEMYCYSHADYEPGEQKNRRFLPPFNKDIRYGHTNRVFHDGRLAKESVNWLPQKLLDKRSQVDSKLIDDFRERHTHQIGKPIDPNKETRLIGPDHVFGLTNMTECFNAADIMHGRTVDKVLKGKERERAFIASLRAYIARHNYTRFKTLVAAFQFFDQDKDGFISKEELIKSCARSGYPIADDMANGVIQDCDVDCDGRLNFLEFSNFLCYKESMDTGLKFDPSDPEVLKEKESGKDYEIKDTAGRILLKASELQPKNNIIGNELVPKTLSKQIDTKVGTWKTTYDVYNEAPYRPEPVRKRVYGVPSIRNDLVAPGLKKINDKNNYGDDGTGWTLMQPSVFTLRGINEKDFLLPRPKDEIKTIFKNIGVDLTDDLFNSVWERAAAQNPYGEVSVEEFRSVLDEMKSSTGKLI